jgi:streptogramin lyase
MRFAVLAALVLVFVTAAEARTAKGDGPTTMAVGYGGVWVGFGDGRVVRVDPDTGRVREVARAGIHVDSMATGFGSLWVTSTDTSMLRDGLYRLDPRSGRVRKVVGPWWSASLAIGAGAVWVADFARNVVFRIDPRTGRVTHAAGVPGRLFGRLAAGDRLVWAPARISRRVVGNGPTAVWRLHPRTLGLRWGFRRSCDMSLLPSGRRVWVLDTCDGTLRRFDPETGSWTEPIRTGPWATSITSGFGSIWVSDGAIVGGKTVYRIDAHRRVVTARIRAKAAHLAADETMLWILGHGDGTTGWLRRIDPMTNRLVGPPIRLSARQ